MTADHRHRQAATRLLLAIPKSDDRVALVAAALAETEARALRDAAGAVNLHHSPYAEAFHHWLHRRADQLDGGDRG